MIYAVYPLLLWALLHGAKCSKAMEWNEEAFSLRQMKAMQGFAALCIMLHHCGQKSSASWINKAYFHPGLEFFVPIGFILVSFFNFCSGYGLCKSIQTKNDYLKDHFFRKRIVPVIALGYVVSLIFLAARFLLGEKLTGQKLLWYLTCMKLCNPNGWYVLIIPIFYFVFWVLYRFCKSDRLATFLMIVFTACPQHTC